MDIIVIVGGQFGGEGKGKLTSYLCKNEDIAAVVRCGGPNSGHTITLDGKQTVLRQIPAGIVNPKTKLLLAAGCLIDLKVLQGEIKAFNINPNMLGIDRNAIIIDEDDINIENEIKLKERIGSTCTGVGSAVSKRVLRGNNLRIAKDIIDLRKYITDTSDELMSYSKGNNKIIIEGTQGFGLSLYHSPYYPYATSRDTTAAAFLSEAGVSPIVLSDIIMVIRTFPIRVAGNSGPLPNEIDWEIIRKESGYPFKIEEFTSVTKKLRRVGRIDLALIKKAITINKPTIIALMGIDYIDYSSKDATHYNHLSDKAKSFISWIEWEIGAKISLIGTGPRDDNLVDIQFIGLNLRGKERWAR